MDPVNVDGCLEFQSADHDDGVTMHVTAGHAASGLAAAMALFRARTGLPKPDDCVLYVSDPAPFAASGPNEGRRRARRAKCLSWFAAKGDTWRRIDTGTCLEISHSDAWLLLPSLQQSRNTHRNSLILSIGCRRNGR